MIRGIMLLGRVLIKGPVQVLEINNEPIEIHIMCAQVVLGRKIQSKLSDSGMRITKKKPPFLKLGSPAGTGITTAISSKTSSQQNFI